jgi:hypothetical protein
MSLRYNGGGRISFFNDIYACRDGRIAAAGNADGTRGWLVCLDNNGNLQWSAYSEEVVRPNTFRSVIECDDHGFLTVGDISRGFGYDDIQAIRTDADGRVIWSRLYAHERLERADAVIELKQGTYLIAGRTNSFRQGPEDGYLIDIEEDGEVIRESTFGDDRYNSFIALRELRGGVIAGGETGEIDGACDFWLVMVNEDREVVWERTFGTELDERFSGMATSPDGGYVLSGSQFREGETVFMLVKVNNLGEEQWIRYFDTDNIRQTICNGVSASPEGYILVGKLNRDYACAIGVSLGGNESWRYVFPMADQDSFRCSLKGVCTRPNGSTLGCGRWESYAINPPPSDGWVVEIRPLRSAPEIIGWSPHSLDTAVLTGSRIEFSIIAEDLQNDSLRYRWSQNDSVISNQNHVIIEYIDVGEYRVDCYVSDEAQFDSIRWNVHVKDLVIARHTPDTLDLTLRRGASQTFTIDSVEAIPDNNPIQYLWTLVDLTNQQSNEIGEDSTVTVDFVRSGNYALTGEAYRGDASDAVTWRVAVRGAVLDFVPPALELTVPTDTTLHFEVFAFNPGSDSLSYAWYYGEDLIGLDSAAEVIFGPEEGLFQVTAVVMDGMEGDTVRWNVRTITPDGIEDCRWKIADWGIKEVWPNPFNSQLTISIKSPSTSASALTSLSIHDITGREVAELDGEWKMENGTKHSVVWDASEFPAGVYLIRVQSGSQVAVKKVVLMR